MNFRHSTTIRRIAPDQRGFTLVELMITVAIAMFLLAGLVTILQNVRSAYANQQSLAQLQDAQRFAMTVLTDVIQVGGYFPDPVVWAPASSLPAVGAYGQGQAFTGTYAAAPPGDSIGVRYRTGFNDGVILCDGSTNTAQNPTGLYINQFSVVPPAGNVPGQLVCSLNGNQPVAIVNGVQNLQIFYGVKQNIPPDDYNVDTYLRADQMANTDWANISSVRVILDFTNPLFGQAGQQATPFIRFERVIEVMARAGQHT